MSLAQNQKKSRPAAFRRHRKYVICAETGKKQPIEFCRKTEADVTTTWIADKYGNETIMCLTQDLDADLAWDCVKDEKGRVCPKKIIEILMKNGDAALASLISDMPRSAGGKGLAIVIPITPLPILEATKRNQDAAKFIQSALYRIFAAYGFGADKGALSGLKRFYTSPYNPKKRLYEKRVVDPISGDSIRLEEHLWRQKGRGDSRSVLSDLAAIVKGHPSTKIDVTRIYNDDRCERKVAKLFEALLDIGYDNNYTLQLTRKEFFELTDCSKNTWYALLTEKKPHWLSLELISQTEGVRFSLIPEHIAHMQRRLSTLKTAPKTKLKTTRKSLLLIEPEAVKDGEHNHWTWSQAVVLKAHGTQEFEALDAIRSVRRRVGRGLLSRNLNTNLAAIVRCIYSKPATRRSQRDLPAYFKKCCHLNLRSETGADRLRALAPPSSSVSSGQSFGERDKQEGLAVARLQRS